MLLVLRALVIGNNANLMQYGGNTILNTRLQLIEALHIDCRSSMRHSKVHRNGKSLTKRAKYLFIEFN